MGKLFLEIIISAVFGGLAAWYLILVFVDEALPVLGY